MINYTLQSSTLSPAVGALVVLFNPDDSVLENISTYINQVSKLFIVDNSEHTNSSIEVYFKSVNKVEYIYNYKNRGVGYVLNLGVEKATQNHFDYLLTINQYTKAPSGMIISLLNSITSSIESHFSRPIIEGWAQRKPVISLEMLHAKEIVNDGVDALLYKSDQIEELAENILNLINQPSRRNALGRPDIIKRVQYLQAIKQLMLLSIIVPHLFNN